MDFVSKKTLVNDHEIRAYVHPVRMEVLRLLAESEATLSELACALDMTPGSLSHHMKLLLDAQLISLVRSEVRGRQRHKIYRSVARLFDVRSDADTTGLNDKVLTLLGDDIQMARTYLSGNDEEFVFGLVRNAKVPRSKLAAFCKRLAAIVADFANEDTEGAQPVSINVSIYDQKRDYGTIGSVQLSKRKRKNS